MNELTKLFEYCCQTLKGQFDWSHGEQVIMFTKNKHIRLREIKKDRHSDRDFWMLLFYGEHGGVIREEISNADYLRLSAIHKEAINSRGELMRAQAEEYAKKELELLKAQLYANF